MELNTVEIPNVFKFEDDELLKTFRTVNLLNDIERIKYGVPPDKNYTSLTRWMRNHFTNHIILFDEAGAILNGRDSKDFDNVMTKYINQNRKIWTDIYIITADGAQSEKSLRRFVKCWFYSKPLVSWFPILRDFKHVRMQSRTEDGKTIEMENFL